MSVICSLQWALIANRISIMVNNTVKGELMNSYELLAVLGEVKLQVCPFLETGDTEKEVVV